MDTNRTYSVYTHKVVTDDKGPMWYVGVTKNVKKRWRPSLYKHCNISLGQYIDKYGWDNIEHRVIAEGLDKEMAYKLEDFLIRMYRSADCCINKQRSGLFETNDKDGYMKEYRKVHSEEIQQYYLDNRDNILERQKQYHKEHPEVKKKYYEDHSDEILEKKRQYYADHIEERRAYRSKRGSTPEWKIYGRVCSFNKRHPELAIETALEAKQKYLETGYIPDYVKNDDLINENNNNNNV